MPIFHEVYGQDVYDQSHDVVEARKCALCPFTNDVCDGGGNRHQTKVKLDKPELRNFFSEELTSVIPGVCSIEYGSETWIVCPRRLLGFSNKSSGVPKVNDCLHDHEREALIQAGLPRGIELGVWPEVYLQYGEDDVSINYHFDFVIAPIKRDQTFKWLLDSYSVDREGDIEDLKNAAKTGKYYKGKFNLDKVLPVLPDLESPTIVEVMTASTSGSDRSAGTDIASSFINAILGKDHTCPGINKRQVWGRMATQLFAKSELAESWGGKTVWLVQDELLKNIELTTRLNLQETPDSEARTVNFLSMSYEGRKRGVNALKFSQYSEKKSGLGSDSARSCTDILLPKVNPDKTTLLKSVLRRQLSAIIVL